MGRDIAQEHISLGIVVCKAMIVSADIGVMDELASLLSAERQLEPD